MKALRLGLPIGLATAILVGGHSVLSALDPTPGAWVLYPEQAIEYSTIAQQPINLDGTSNFKSNGNAVIPVKFGLSFTYGSAVLQSIASDTDTANDYSYLSFTPDAPLTFADLYELKANYTFIEGNCHGGALRWSVRVSPTQSVFIYYGATPNFTDCTTTNQSGVNMLTLNDLRFDTSQVGGTFYDSYANALALVGPSQVVRVSLLLDGGWAGDQVIEPVTNVTVNGNTFVPLSGTAQTCDLPAATIQITKVSGAPSGVVNAPTSIQPADDNNLFRVVDCRYMYNLATSSLSGVGRYRVEALIGGNPASGAAEFDLR